MATKAYVVKKGGASSPKSQGKSVAQVGKKVAAGGFDFPPASGKPKLPPKAGVKPARG